MFGMNWLEDYIRAGLNETSKEQLAKLAASDNQRIRMRVAENPNTPASILELLAKDKDADVRLAVATNRSSPIDVVYALALDEDPTVRHGLAEDPNSPAGVLKILKTDENAYVSFRAKKTMALLEDKKSRNNSSQIFSIRNRNRTRYA